MKEKATQVLDNAKNVIKNAEQLAQAIALLTVAVFSYYALGHIELNDVVYGVVIASLAIIGLRGSAEFLSFLNKKG